jgi:hypothetical protein
MNVPPLCHRLPSLAHTFDHGKSQPRSVRQVRGAFLRRPVSHTKLLAGGLSTLNIANRLMSCLFAAKGSGVLPLRSPRLGAAYGRAAYAGPINATAHLPTCKQQSRQRWDQRLCLIASNNAAPVQKRHRQGAVEPGSNQWKGAPADRGSIRPRAVAPVRSISCGSQP